jgi:protein TonB
MSYALSRRGAKRHPLGLSVVVGLHALLAVVLVTSRIAATRPPVDPPVTVLPPPVIEKHVEPTQTPKPNQPTLTRPEIVVPVIPDDERKAPPIAARPDDGERKVLPPPIEVARVDDPPKAVRVQAHAAVINAAASQCRPEYPPAAVRVGATGISKIRFTVDPSGKVSGAQILNASGPTREHRMLDKAAAEALAQCPITVGTDDMGRAVGTTVDVEYVWRLD